jgi:hypothetical protein
VVRDPSLNRMAAVDMARGPLRLHRIRVNPAHGDVAEYMIVFQCGMILRKFALPPADRYDFGARLKGRRDAEKLVSDHFRGRGLPSQMVRGLRDQLFDGLMLQLVSIPLSLRIDAWVAVDHAELADQQRVAVTRQLQENTATLRPEVKKMAPERIVTPSLTMNSALAAYWSRRWDDPLLSLPYRSANLGQAGLNLLKTFDDIPPTPGHDRELVDGWAKQLGLGGWYEWVPYTLDDA